MKISAMAGAGRPLPYGSGHRRTICVFFAQHSDEKRPRDLWEWRFFIAPAISFDNVCGATEGASPCRAFRVDGSHRVASPSLAIKVGSTAGYDKFFRASGEQGEVPSVPVALGGDVPSQ